MENLYNKNYSLPTEITTETRIFKVFTVRVIVILFLFLFFGTRLMDNIYLPLQVPFLIFHMIVGILFCINSEKNLKKKLYQSVLIAFTRDRKYYKPIPDTNKLPDTMKKFYNYPNAVIFIEPNSQV